QAGMRFGKVRVEFERFFERLPFLSDHLRIFDARSKGDSAVTLGETDVCRSEVGLQFDRLFKQWKRFVHAGRDGPLDRVSRLQEQIVSLRTDVLPRRARDLVFADLQLYASRDLIRDLGFEGQ